MYELWLLSLAAPLLKYKDTAFSKRTGKKDINASYLSTVYTILHVWGTGTLSDASPRCMHDSKKPREK